MPPGHIAVTWAVSHLLQRSNPQLSQLDYRLLALSAMLPDFIDKPLAIWVFPDSHSSQNVTHSLLFNGLLLVLSLLIWQKALPYTIAFNAHILADKMWYHTETFWWPLYGWDIFWQYKFMNTPTAMLQVYLDIIVTYPHVWLTELVALGVLSWFVYQYRWYRWRNLRQFIKTGRLFSTQVEQNKNPQRHMSNVFLWV